MGFTKLWANIIHSSIWHEGHDTLRVWIYLLAMVGPDGIAQTSVPDVSARCFIPPDRTREILLKLSEPDLDSRSLNDEGRRIERVDGGYFVINYQKYREMRDEEERKRQVREAVRRHRQRQKEEVNQHGNQDVIQSNMGKPRKAQAEAEAEAEKEKNKAAFAGAKAADYSLDFLSFWNEYPTRNGKKVLKKAAFQEWQTLKPTPELQAAIAAALKQQKENFEMVRGRGDFAPEFPDACRWLKNRRWEDEVQDQNENWMEKVRNTV